MPNKIRSSRFRLAPIFARRTRPAALLAFATLALASAGANAEGITRVQQSNGSVQVYHHVDMQLVGQTLRLHSPDRKGFLEVSSSACSLIGEVQRCLPYSTILHQHGEAHQIALERGTLYLNLSGDAQPLRHSSEKLGPHQVLLLLHTMRGTIVSVKGTLDGVR